MIGIIYTLLASIMALTSPADVSTTFDEATDAECIAFLSSRKPGAQQRQAQAIETAMAGDYEALHRVRSARNTSAALPDSVEAIDVCDGMRLYRRTDKADITKPVLIYLHGGGWVLGSINSCSRYCSRLAAEGRVAVLAVDYRLAPEYPYPTAIDDCTAAYEWILQNGAAWNLDTTRISIGGDSSGGNLALATAITLQKAGRKVDSLILFYPVVRSYCDGTESWRQYSSGYGQDSDLMMRFIEAYLPAEADRHSGLASPADADDNTLRQLPRTLLVAAGKDILCDQGREFAIRLQHLGVDIHRIEFSQSCHLFITVDGQPTAFNEAVRLSNLFLSE